MILTKVHVTKFQSIKDSNIFEIGDITCLVGKNEAGKTSLLKALYRLNPIINEDAKFDITDDYPRTEVEDYRQDVESGNINHDNVIKATFEMEEYDLVDLKADMGKKCLANNTLILCKGYDNETYYTISLNENEIFKFLIRENQLTNEVASELTKISDFDKGIEFLNTTEKTEEVKKLISLFDKINKDGINEYVYNLYIKRTVPKFLYFDDYYQLTGQENIEALTQRINQKQLRPSDHPMLGLIDLARLDLPELVNPDRTQSLMNKLEGASNHLSKKILRYWSQNKHLKMSFNVRPGRPGDPEDLKSGNNIWAQIYDQKRWVHTNLGTRSRGFVWFFSFLSWYSKVRKEYKKVILLLDEPGLSLHAKAQEDLLKYFEEELKPFHQLIYSTHSPFMVDSTKFSRVRIVQDKSIEEDLDDEDLEGTKVFTEVLDASEDSLFPLQGALGYEIYQTLFVGPNILVVEGVSDLLFLQAISSLLNSKGKISLSNDWTITPVGGSDKVPTFVALLGSQKGLKVATLIDIQKKDTQTIENLLKRKLLKKSHVLTFGDFTGKKEADIEDMFENDFYLSLLNNEYKTHLTSSIKIKDLNNKIPRIVNRIQNYLTTNPFKDNISFNHFRPSRYFNENLSKLANSISDETETRFENAFKKLNELL